MVYNDKDKDNVNEQILLLSYTAKSSFIVKENQCFFYFDHEIFDLYYQTSSCLCLLECLHFCVFYASFICPHITYGPKKKNHICPFLVTQSMMSNMCFALIFVLNWNIYFSVKNLYLIIINDGDRHIHRHYHYDHNQHRQYSSSLR